MSPKPSRVVEESTPFTPEDEQALVEGFKEIAGIYREQKAEACREIARLEALVAEQARVKAARANGRVLGLWPRKR